MIEVWLSKNPRSFIAPFLTENLDTGALSLVFDEEEKTKATKFKINELQGVIYDAIGSQLFKNITPVFLVRLETDIVYLVAIKLSGVSVSDERGILSYMVKLGTPETINSMVVTDTSEGKLICYPHDKTKDDTIFVVNIKSKKVTLAKVKDFENSETFLLTLDLYGHLVIVYDIIYKNIDTHIAIEHKDTVYSVITLYNPIKIELTRGS